MRSLRLRMTEDDRPTKLRDQGPNICRRQPSSAREMSHAITDFSSVDIAQLRYFLAAAEHLNYTRAAAVLCVCPSTLSRQIHHLEDSLGVSVFERDRNGIRLTVAGRHFQRNTERFMFEFSRAIANASRAGKAEIGDLRLGLAPWVLSGPLQRFVETYRRQLPGVEFRFSEGEYPELISALHERHVDIAVGYKDLVNAKGVAAMQLWQEQLCIAVPKVHPLASRRSIKWEFFEGQTVVVRGWTEPPSAYKELARRLPRNIDITHHLVSSGTLLNLVSAGCGLVVLPHSATNIRYPGVIFRPIHEDDAKATVFAAWLDESDNPVKVKFLANLRDYVGRLGDGH
jgi:DNA-binding transcriptional LysR family regulator